MENHLTTSQIVRIQKLYEAGLNAEDISEQYNMPFDLVSREISIYLNGMEDDYIGFDSYDDEDLDIED